MSDALCWDDSYAIAKTLQRRFPSLNLADVSLEMIQRWTLELPDFSDDPNSSNDAILMAIYREWLEEDDA